MDRQHGYIGACLFVLWLGATGFAFWWLDYRQVSQYQAVPLAHDTLTQSLESAVQTLPIPLGSTALLVHFSDPDCPCDSASRRHLHDLQARYPALAFTPAAPDSTLWPMLASLPAAALFDNAGQLLYFGPYSSGPVCGTGINFVDEQLAALARQDTVAPYINDMAFGCFCEPSIFFTG